MLLRSAEHAARQSRQVPFGMTIDSYVPLTDRIKAYAKNVFLPPCKSCSKSEIQSSIVDYLRANPSCFCTCRASSAQCPSRSVTRTLVRFVEDRVPLDVPCDDHVGR